MNEEYINLKKWLEETADEPLESMSGFFEARISDYEEHMSFCSEHYKWTAKLLPENIENLLDLGCGTGLELDAIFPRFPELKVTGIDLSVKMLEKLKSKHKTRALNLIEGDYFKYDFGENVFDAAVSVETLHHFTAEKKTGLFSKIFNSLKSGGVYLECDYIAETPEIEELTFSECKRRRIRDGIPDDVYVHFDTPLTLEHEMDALKKAGFSLVENIGFPPASFHTPIIRAVK